MHFLLVSCIGAAASRPHCTIAPKFGFCFELLESKSGVSKRVRNLDLVSRRGRGVACLAYNLVVWCGSMGRFDG
jgi:hypothetical protein